MAKGSDVDRLIANFKRVITNKGANWQFPERVKKLVFADRSTMTPQEKSAQTRTLKRYAKDRYKELYKESKVESGQREYTVEEYRKIPKAEREEIEESYGRQHIPASNRPTELDAMEDYIDEFIAKLQRPTSHYFVGHGGKTAKRWELLVNLSEEKQNELLTMAHDAASMNPYGFGKNLKNNWSQIDELTNSVLYGSSSAQINSAYSVLMDIIMGGLSMDEREMVEGYEDWNSDYDDVEDEDL